MHPHPSEVPRRSARFLVLEDSPECMELMAYLLESAGHSVRRAPTLARALANLRNVPIDLVVCDMHLRGASGLDLLRSARSEPGLADIPIVAITASPGSDLPARARALGFDAFIHKPIQPREFVRELELVLERVGTCGRPPPALGGGRAEGAGTWSLAG